MGKFRGHLKVTAGAAVLLLCAAAAAQQATPQPGRDRPLPEAAPIPELDFTIQAPRRSAVPRAVEELTFDVKDLRFTGGTHYGEEVLRPLAQPVIGQTVHLNDLLSIAEALEARYHADGFVLTRVFVPTQSVSDGVFQISIVEGYVSAVAVQGGDQATRDRVERLMAPILRARPLTLATLESCLLTANKLPGVAAAGLLRPSATDPGASELVVTLRDLPQVQANVNVNNAGAPSTGRWTLGADATTASPLGDGGQFNLNGSMNPADPNSRYSVGGRYVAPLPVLDGLTYTLSALGSHGAPGGTVAALNLITNSTAFGARATLPVLVSRAEEFSLDGGLTIQSSDVKALGQTASHDEWRVLDLAATYRNNIWLGGTSSVTLDLAEGLPGMGATGTPLEGLHTGSSNFTKVTAQANHVQPLTDKIDASISLSGQYANLRPVLGEEINFGGESIGRGYDPGSLTGDMGIGAALELTYSLPPSWFYADSAKFFGYFDSAEIWNHDGATPNASQIAAIGGGLRLTVLDNVNLEFLGGQALMAVPGSEKGKRATRVLFHTALHF